MESNALTTPARSGVETPSNSASKPGMVAPGDPNILSTQVENRHQVTEVSRSNPTFGSKVNADQEKNPKTAGKHGAERGSTQGDGEGDAAVRDMFEKPKAHPRVIEADRKEADLKSALEKKDSEHKAAVSAANAGLQMQQDIAESLLRAQSESGPSHFPDFAERASARRAAAEALGSTMPARNVESYPTSTPPLDNVPSVTHGPTRSHA